MAYHDIAKGRESWFVQGRFAMFFYTSIFIASMVLALVVIWLSRSVIDAGRAIYRSMLPSTKSGPVRRSGRKKTTAFGTPAPWGWKGSPSRNQTRNHPASPAAAIPWGWRGNVSSVRDRGRAARNGADLNSYLRRQDSQDVVATHSRTAMQNAGKPWGW